MKDEVMENGERMRIEKCKSCRYFEPIYFLCNRYPPKILTYPKGTIAHKRPKVWDSEYCGEYRRIRNEYIAEYREKDYVGFWKIEEKRIVFLDYEKYKDIEIEDYVELYEQEKLINHRHKLVANISIGDTLETTYDKICSGRYQFCDLLDCKQKEINAALNGDAAKIGLMLKDYGK